MFVIGLAIHIELFRRSLPDLGRELVGAVFDDDGAVIVAVP